MDSGLTKVPILVFKLTVFDRFTNNTDVESMRASLEVNPKLIKAFGNIHRPQETVLRPAYTTRRSILGSRESAFADS
jgi:hypothetical protein